jgi:hypothetical protein
MGRNFSQLRRILNEISRSDAQSANHFSSSVVTLSGTTILLIGECWKQWAAIVFHLQFT